MKLYINDVEIADFYIIQIEAVSNPDSISIVIDGNKNEEQIHIVDDSFELRLEK